MVILIGIIVVSVCVLIFNTIYINTNWHKNFVGQLRRFIYMPDNIQVVNIGSGQSVYNFDWSWNTSVRGYNMAVLPEDFRYDYRILKRNINKLNSSCVVIQVIGPLSFARNDYLHEYDFSLRYAHVLSRKEVDLPAYMYYLEKYLPILSRPGRIKLLLKKQVGENKKLETSISVKEKQYEADSMVELWLKQNNGLKDLKDANQAELFQESFDKNIDDLNNIYNYCREQGLNFFVVIPPISEYLGEKFTVEFLNRFLFCNINRSDIPDNRVINTIFDSEYRELDYYTNGLFLNSDASKKYTQKIFMQIKKIYWEM